MPIKESLLVLLNINLFLKINFCSGYCGRDQVVEEQKYHYQPDYVGPFPIRHAQ